MHVSPSPAAPLPRAVPLPAEVTYYPNVLIDLSVTSEFGAQVNKTYGTSFENPQWIGYILTGALLDNKTDASMKVSQTKRRGSICRES